MVKGEISNTRAEIVWQPTGKISKGRPRKRWMDRIRKDLETFRIDALERKSLKFIQNC